jgi:DNA-binding NarL/FixJ family response regulator
MRSALREILTQSDVNLSAICNSAEELLALETPTDVVLITLGAGIDLSSVNLIRLRWEKSKIVLWVDDIPAWLAHQAHNSGVRGLLRRTLPEAMIIKCIQRVAAGEIWYEKNLTESLLKEQTVRLTKREAELVRLLSQGLKNKEIATFLSISQGTVKVYLSKLFKKLGAKDRVEVALFGLKHSQFAAPDMGTEANRVFFLGGDKAPDGAKRSVRGSEGDSLLSRMVH